MEEIEANEQIYGLKFEFIHQTRWLTNCDIFWNLSKREIITDYFILFFWQLLLLETRCWAWQQSITMFDSCLTVCSAHRWVTVHSGTLKYLGAVQCHDSVLHPSSMYILNRDAETERHSSESSPFPRQCLTHRSRSSVPQMSHRAQHTCGCI